MAFLKARRRLASSLVKPQDRTIGMHDKVISTRAKLSGRSEARFAVSNPLRSEVWMLDSKQGDDTKRVVGATAEITELER